MEHLRKAGQTEGQRKLRLFCLASNLRARRFYDRYGQPSGHLRDIILNGISLPHIEYEILLQLD